jgi:hypothetical protein
VTQTLRRPPRQDPNVRRKGRIYLFRTLRVHESGPRVGLVLDGSTEEGYVGKTRQTLSQREQQHRGGAPDGEVTEFEDLEEQPWFEITVGGIQLLEQGMWTDDELAERERFWIRQIGPRYNYVDNLNCKRRIPKPVAREHRDARDRAKGLPPRDWPAFGTAPQPRQTPATRPTPPRPARTARLSAAWRRRLLKAAAFPLATGVLWLALVLYAAPRGAGERWQVWPVLALAVVTEAFALPLVRRVKKRDRGLAVLGITAAVAMLAGALYGWWTGG